MHCCHKSSRRAQSDAARLQNITADIPRILESAEDNEPPTLVTCHRLTFLFFFLYVQDCTLIAAVTQAAKTTRVARGAAAQQQHGRACFSTGSAQDVPECSASSCRRAPCVFSARQQWAVCQHRCMPTRVLHGCSCGQLLLEPAGRLTGASGVLQAHGGRAGSQRRPQRCAALRAIRHQRAAQPGGCVGRGRRACIRRICIFIVPDQGAHLPHTPFPPTLWQLIAGYFCAPACPGLQPGRMCRGQKGWSWLLCTSSMQPAVGHFVAA